MPSPVQEARRQHIKELQKGSGLYLFRNKSQTSSISLPKPSLDNPPRRDIPPQGTFLGDSYHAKQCAVWIQVERIIENPDTPQTEITKHEILDPETGKISKPQAEQLGPDTVLSAPGAPSFQKQNPYNKHEVLGADTVLNPNVSQPPYENPTSPINEVTTSQSISGKPGRKVETPEQPKVVETPQETTEKQSVETTENSSKEQDEDPNNFIEDEDLDEEDFENDFEDEDDEEFEEFDEDDAFDEEDDTITEMLDED